MKVRSEQATQTARERRKLILFNTVTYVLGFLLWQVIWHGWLKP